ncbi:ERF-like protein [Zea mays]|uniref:ERF-like protein n=1 Tax=Zea mays TaxID=4577 RepID=A0A1D6IN05_MAIZE|nr:ERF-like protein [Zea mays]
MCGGAIISEFIPHRGAKRGLCAEDIWPHAAADFDDLLHAPTTAPRAASAGPRPRSTSPTRTRRPSTTTTTTATPTPTPPRRRGCSPCPPAEAGTTT